MNPTEFLKPEDVRAVLSKAADVAGGMAQLADRMSVPAVEMQKWMSGAVVPPMHAMLTILKVVGEETVAAADRHMQPRQDGSGTATGR